MGKAPCCDKHGVKRGAWSPDEEAKLVQYIKEHGHGLLRCGKSCWLRWINYLRPDIKRGPFSPEEEATIIQLHGLLGNKWAAMASYLPGRTDNEVKSFWNTRLKKRLLCMDHYQQRHQSPSSSEPSTIKSSESPSPRHVVQWKSVRVEAEARLSVESSSLLNSPLADKTDSDIFLRLWNSTVGESFRGITKKHQGVCENANAITGTSPQIMLESGSVVTIQANATSTSSYTLEKDDSYRSKVDMVAGSDSISSNEFIDSSDAALKVLRDFSGVNDMEFINEPADNISNFLNLQCE